MSRPPSQSYLLRLWRENQRAPLRATLVLVARPEVVQHFADLEAMYAFLRAQAGEEPDISEQWDRPCWSPPEMS
jgi:hypothetical protein